MKLLTTITAAALVMAATGCETAQEKEARGLVQKPNGKWVPKGTPYFGDGVPIKMPPGSIAYDPTVFNQAMAAQQAPPVPVVVTGAGGGTTIASQVGGTTVVSQIGGQPLYLPPPPPIYTGNSTPTVYTMPLQQ